MQDKVFEKNTIRRGGWRFFSKPEGLDLDQRRPRPNLAYGKGEKRLINLVRK
jgi:hypothetical protein